MADKWITQGELAVHLGITPRQVQNLEAKGLPNRGHRETKRYPRDKCSDWWSNEYHYFAERAKKNRTVVPWVQLGDRDKHLRNETEQRELRRRRFAEEQKAREAQLHKQLAERDARLKNLGRVSLPVRSESIRGTLPR